MNKLVHTAEDRADVQIGAEIKTENERDRGREGRKRQREKKTGQGRKGNRRSLPGSLTISHFASVLRRPD